MANTDFSVLLKAELDKSGINTELNKVQEIVKKYHLELIPDLQTSSLRNQFKSVCQGMANDFNKTFGTNVTANDMFKVYENKARQLEQTLQHVSKIQLSYETGGYESKVDSLIAKTNQWVDANGNARISTDSLQIALNNLDKAYLSLTADGGNTQVNQQALIQAEQALDKEIKTVTNSITSMNAEFMKTSAIDNLRQKYQQFLDLNGKIKSTSMGTQITSAIKELGSGMEVTVARGKELESQLTKIQNVARQTGKLGKTWFQTLRDGMSSFSYWTSSTFLVMKAIQSVKGGLSSVYALDTALVDLKKTTTMTANELEDFYYAANDVAKQMGVTTEEIINQASAWSRLGYSSAEAATKMAKYSSMFASISPGMDVDTATTELVSIMKAFGIGNDNPDDVLDGILSKINIIGNTAATSNAEIAEGLGNSSAAMATMNATLDETIALFTAGQEIVQNASQVGNALRSISLRIRGYDEETEELSDDLVNITGEVIDLTKAASNNYSGISLFTDTSQTEYKSIYTYLQEISEVYDELDAKSQQSLLEKLFGKNRAQVGAAILNNFEAASKAIDNMANSAGSAEAEMSVIEDSLEFKLNALKETGTGISQNLFQRDDMKTVVGVLTKLAEALDFATDKLGLFGTTVLGTGITAFVKNFA